MRLVIPGNPIVKRRHRHYSRGSFVQTYDPQEKEKLAMKKLLTQLLNCTPDSEWPGKASNFDQERAYYLDLTFHMALPQTVSQSKRNAKLWGFEFPTREDLDNLVKFILDCANGILYPDDKFVMSFVSVKLYSENPRTEIEIMVKENFDLPEQLKKVLLQFSPKELEEFFYDLEEVNSKNPQLHQITDGSFSSERLMATTRALAFFAKKYAKKLNKIEKLCA